MKKIITVVIIVVCVIGLLANYLHSQRRIYTVMFINNTDTGYLLNSCPLTYKEAKEIANGFGGQKSVVLFNRRSLPPELISAPMNKSDINVSGSGNTIEVWDTTFTIEATRAGISRYIEGDGVLIGPSDTTIVIKSIQ